MESFGIRTLLIDTLNHGTLKLFEGRVMVHYFFLTAVLYVTFIIFFKERQMNLCSSHAFFMTVGVLFFVAEAIVAKNNKLIVEFFSPIMEGNRGYKEAVVHSTLNMVGLTFVCLGISLILAHKWRTGQPLWSGSLHAYTGAIALVLISAQVIMAYCTKRDQSSLADSVSDGPVQESERYTNRLSERKKHNWRVRHFKVPSFHRELGLIVWDTLILALLLGIQAYLKGGSSIVPQSQRSGLRGSPASNSFTLASGRADTAGVLASVFIVTTWLIVHIQSLRSKRAKDAFLKRQALEMQELRNSISEGNKDVGNGRESK